MARESEENDSVNPNLADFEKNAMCGIVGIIAKSTHIPTGLLDRATQSLAHRGPDDSGTIIVRESTPAAVEIGFGNRRLAILDLSPLGHQPMHDPVTGNWIVYNG